MVKPLVNDTESVPLTLIESSQLKSELQHHMTHSYQPMELWYFRISVEKAHQIDEFDTNSKPTVSSVLDDTFFILKKIIQRLISAASASTLRSALHEVRQILDRDYVGGLRRKIEATLASVAGQVTGSPSAAGRGRDDERDRKEAQVKSSLIVKLSRFIICMSISTEFTGLFKRFGSGSRLHRSSCR